MLDVGCGSGIVALLLRQAACAAGRPVEIVAVDIDLAAAQQARENAAASPWADVDVQHASLEEYASVSVAPFELIVSNPPYFPRPPPHIQQRNVVEQARLREGKPEAATAAPTLWPQSRAHARFREYLPPDELLQGAARLLAPRGSFWCVYPVSENSNPLRSSVSIEYCGFPLKWRLFQ